MTNAFQEGSQVCWEISFYTPDREKNYAFGILMKTDENNGMALVKTGDGKETWMPLSKLKAPSET